MNKVLLWILVALTTMQIVMAAIEFGDYTLILNETFDGSSGWSCDSETGGTCNKSAWQFATSADYDLNDYSSVVAVWSWKYPSSNSHKMYGFETTTSTSNAHILCDTSGGNMLCKNEPGYLLSCTGDTASDFQTLTTEWVDSTEEVELYMNHSSNCGWSYTSDTVDRGLGRDYFRAQAGGDVLSIDWFAYYVPTAEMGGGGGGNPYNGTITVDLESHTSDTNVTYNEFFNFTVNVTCSVGECGDVLVYLDPVLTPTDTNTEGETWAQMFEEYLDAWEYHNNIHVDIDTYTGVPWYTSSTECSNADLQQQCPNINEDDVTQSFCMASDEVSQVFMVSAMDRDGESARTVNGILNLISSIASPLYGSMTVWRTGFNNGALDSSEASNNDCASDADARFIIGAAIAKNNTNFNSSVRGSAISYLDQACPDFITYTVWNETGNNEAVCPSGGEPCREVSYFSTGGCDVGTNGNFGWGNAFYTGYLGDNAIAMLACYAHTNETTYRAVAGNITQMYLGVAGYNSTSGFVVPDGKEFNLGGGSAGARELSCDVSCGGWEDADAVRAVSICTAGYIADELMGFNLTSDIKTYCQEWIAASGYSSTSYARQRTPSGGYTGGYGSDYVNNGLAAYLDIYVNQANLDERHDEIDVDFDDSNQRFDGTCMAVYNPTFSIVSLGYASGYADGAFSEVAPPTSSKGLISTVVGATPFYTTEYNPENYTHYGILQDMQPGESVIVWWDVNATNTVGTYTFFAYADSNETGVTTVDSASVDLTIEREPDFCLDHSAALFCDDFEDGNNATWSTLGDITVDTMANALNGNYSMNLTQDIVTYRGFVIQNFTSDSITSGVLNFSVTFRVLGDDPETRNVQLQLSDNACSDCSTDAISFSFSDNGNIKQQWSTGSNGTIPENWSLNTNYVANIVLDLTNDFGNMYLNGTRIGTANFTVTTTQMLYLKIGDTTSGDIPEAYVDDVVVYWSEAFNNTAPTLTLINVTHTYDKNATDLIQNANGTDVDEQTLTYSMVSPSFNKITINSGSGSITYNTSLNASDIGSYEARVTVTDGTNSTSENFTLTIIGFEVDDCGTGAFNIINFLLFNEDYPTNQINGTLEVLMDYWVTNPDNSLTFNNSYTNNNVFQMCIANESNSINTDLLYAQYTTPSGFTQRFYQINATYAPNETVNYTLYNFNTTTSISDLSITTRYRSNYNPYPLVLAHLQRLYVGEGTWRTVQMDRSGDYGNVHFNIKEETTDYTLIFYDENNNILRTTDSMKFVCTSGVCTLQVLLDEYATTSITGDNTASYTYDTDQELLNITWTNNDGDTITTTTRITRESMTGQVVVCDETQSGTSGFVSCDISAHNSQYFVEVDMAGERIISNWFDSPSERLSDVLSIAEQSFFTALLAITVTAVGLVSPAATLIFLVVSLMIIYFLGIFSGLTMGIIITAAAIGILIGLRVRN